MKHVIVASLNRYLDCDPERVGQLNQIEDKVIALTIKELETTLYLQVVDLHLESITDTDVSPDVELIVSLQVLPDFLLGVDRNQLIKNGDIEIIGDTHVASVFNNTLCEIEIDWEELLAARVGDTLAYQIGISAKKVSGLYRRFQENIRLDMRDYLQDSLQVAATQFEVDEFIQDVDKLRAQVDRLEARLNRLDMRS